MIVDEAQDTIETQLRCLRLLKAAGLRSLVLIGDPDQAIYGFAGVRPEHLAGAVSDLGLATVPLTQNYRSSQRLCNATAHFRTVKRADDAAGEHRDCAYVPELIVYTGHDYGGAVTTFTDRLTTYGIAAAGASVVCWHRRTRDIVNSTGGGTFSGMMADYAELAAVVQQQHTIGRSTIERIEAELATHAWPDEVPEEFDTEQRYRLRTAAFELAELLPDLNLSAKDWCAGARTVVGATITDLRNDGAAVRYRKQTPRGTGRYRVADLIAGRQNALLAQTIHAVKGESHDATLVIAVKDENFDHAHDWLFSDGEERRVGYVALTRAKRYVAVAVPDTTSAAVRLEFQRRGFRTIHTPRTAENAGG